MLRFIKRWWAYRKLRKTVRQSTFCCGLPWDAAHAEEVARRTRDFLDKHRGSLEATIENPVAIRVTQVYDKDDIIVPLPRTGPRPSFDWNA